MPTLRAWLAEEPFELVLTSGFFGFFAHAGMLSALLDAGLAPRAAAGSSAGALVSAAWASGVPMSALVQTLRTLRREDFWDPGPGLGLLRGRSFRRRLEEMLPVARFEDCPAPLSISTYDVTRRRTHVIRRGEIAPAVVASCAVPLLFHPVRHDGRWLLDGGLADRPGLAAAGSGRKLVHHLASRSPWRVRLDVPRAPLACTLVIEGLPRSGPGRLEDGVRALALAREATARALDEEVQEGVVRVVP
ncbi:MAG: patatin-like phospholipase family protein [Sandaracinus sp.]